MKTSVIIPPRGEPLSLAEAKIFLKINHAQEDNLIEELIATARQMIEIYTRRKLLAQQVASIIPFHPNHHKKKGLQRIWNVGDRYALFLPRGPVQRVARVERIFEDGTTKELEEHQFHVNLRQDPPLLVIDDRSGWGAWVTYDVGYGESPLDVPAPLRHAVRQMMAYLYAHRDQDASQCNALMKSLVAPYVLMAGAL